MLLRESGRLKISGREVFVLDDGFQHLELARDLDIVTIDATNPFGNGRLLPYGRLREPVAGLSRAGCVVITRTEQVEDWRLVEDKVSAIIGKRSGILIKDGDSVGAATHSPAWSKQKT